MPIWWFFRRPAVEGAYVIVRRPRADASDQAFIQRPDFRCDRGVVGIDQQAVLPVGDDFGDRRRVRADHQAARAHGFQQ